MNSAHRDDHSRPQDQGRAPLLLSASTLKDNEVYNLDEERLGSIKELMVDVQEGRICYAVLTLGGFLGLGEKLFAVPWKALSLDTEFKRFVLDVDLERLQQAPGFDHDHWPDMADTAWVRDIKDYYGVGLG